MISRRLVRVKTLQSLYAWQQSGSGALAPELDQLRDRLHHSHQFYLHLLALPHALQEHLSEKQAKEKTKYYPDTSKIRALGVLNRSGLIGDLYNASVSSKNSPFSWHELSEHFDAWYAELSAQSFWVDYSVFDEPNFEQQQYFLETLFLYLFETYEPFHDTLVEYYPGWTDDDPYVSREIAKTLASAKPGNIHTPAPLSKHHEDWLFAQDLLRHCAEDGAAFESLVSTVTVNWDPGRIAVLDLLIIKMTLAEFLYCPEIPVKVTINEYLEITKNYSTPNSSRFINGVLDRLRLQLEADGKIVKSGRGLKQN
jgi:N utilization substance protein B